MKKELIPGLAFVAALALAAAPAFAAEVEAGTRPAGADADVPATADEGGAQGRADRRLPHARGAREGDRPAGAREAVIFARHDAPRGNDPVSSAVREHLLGTELELGSFAGDKITGLDTFYQGFSGSNYAGTSTEYTGSNGQVNGRPRSWPPPRLHDGPGGNQHGADPRRGVQGDHELPWRTATTPSTPTSRADTQVIVPGTAGEVRTVQPCSSRSSSASTGMPAATRRT